MPEQLTEPATLEELHQFVHNTLCHTENLLVNQFQTRQAPLLSRGRICGMEYSLQGLRSVRLTAIWAADANTVYFYDARGERFQKVRLKHHIPLPSTAAAG